MMPPPWETRFNTYFREEKSQNFQPKPFLAQLEAIPSSNTSCLWDEANLQLPTTSFQVLVENNKVSPQPPPLQTKTSCPFLAVSAPMGDLQHSPRATEQVLRMQEFPKEKIRARSQWRDHSSPAC